MFKRYSRYHRDGNGLLGFDFWWSKETAPVYGDRLVTLISGSFWASMTGAPYATVARVSYPWEIEPKSSGNPQVATAPAVPQAAPVPSPAAPPERTTTRISAGSGFFVSQAGHILTSAHVVEGCSSVVIRVDGQTAKGASVLAQVSKNDLALIKAAGSPTDVLPIRPGVRLGEGVAAFGFLI
ncbi:S1 family peptidase [Bosea sp. NBC_00550]|uniref:S1 family peptidase n=1 Tax=Bosea sp. NBC_00550 TaxID=2969621 RepID=UPI00222F0695|nr:serine protease [Bosea sp. NBC_00550]UZF94810.1 serine protease [Bosea sp. NBC_00550]